MAHIILRDLCGVRLLTTETTELRVRGSILNSIFVHDPLKPQKSYAMVVRGLLLNFGTPRLQIKRLILTDEYRRRDS